MKERISNSVTEGAFFQCINAISFELHRAGSEHTDLILALASLNNERKIDVPKEFCGLVNNRNNGADFFMNRRIFEEVLPSLDSPIEDISDCVSHLYSEAGGDLAAGRVLTAFEDYLRKNAGLAKATLTYCLESGGNHLNLLASSLVVGSEESFESFFKETLRLSEDANPEISARAIWVLGRLQYPENSQSGDVAFCLLESLAKNSDVDRLHGSIINSCIELFKQVSIQEDRICSLLESAFRFHGVQALHSAADMLMRHTDTIAVKTTNCLLNALQHLDHTNEGTAQRIDFGVSRLLESSKSTHTDIAVDFLDNYCAKCPLGEWAERNLSCISHSILSNPDKLLNKIATRWLFSGDRNKCEILHAVVSSSHRDKITISVDVTEIDTTKSTNIFYIARKAVGFLFTQQISATSFLISLFPHCSDKDIQGSLVQLLFDPLLLNYPGALREYLSSIPDEAPRVIRDSCTSALELYDKYTDGLNSIDEISEIQPPSINLYAHRKRMSALFDKSMKDAQSKSIFLSLVSKSTLLYGKSSINYIERSPDTERERVVMPLKPMSHSIELPRQSVLNPAEFDFMLRVFRNERFA